MIKNEEAVFIRGCVFLATYQHKHGTDYSIHKTAMGAREWHKSIADEYRDSFLDIGDSMYSAELDDLVDEWHDITNYSEFFDILELNIRD